MSPPTSDDTSRNPLRLDLFRISLPICAVVAVVGIWKPDELASAAGVLTTASFRALDWFYMAAVASFLGLCLWLALSRFGSVTLGADGEEPEFSLPSWLSMLFAAGMGVGLLFWGVAEPVTHFGGALGIDTSEPAKAARAALVVTSFHWGFHAWAVYGVAALVLAYFGFRKKTAALPGAPLLATFKGAWVSPVAKASNLLAVLAIAFGVAGSVSMGIFQLHTGLSVVFGIAPQSTTIDVIILFVLVVAYMTSASTSLDKGIQILSNLNMVLALLLMVFILFAGPTGHLLRGFFTGVGDYASTLVSLSLRLYPYDDGRGWLEGWTLTYWVWWIAWAPFVGVFIARISRGRTIREFVFGVLFVPTLFSILWFSIFGGFGLYEEFHGAGGITELVRDDISLALFTLFERLPFSSGISVLALVLVFVFLVTSVDSATFVLGMLTSNGSMDPPTSRKIGWGVALGALGAALMLSGNVIVVRSVAVLGAIPFTFVLVLQAAALVRTLWKDHPAPARPKAAPRPTEEGGDQ